VPDGDAACFGNACLGRPETIAPLGAARDIYAKVGVKPLLDRVEAALAVRPVGTATAGSTLAGEAV
jgi:hypothetical protein